MCRMVLPFSRLLGRGKTNTLPSRKNLRNVASEDILVWAEMLLSLYLSCSGGVFCEFRVAGSHKGRLKGVTCPISCPEQGPVLSASGWLSHAPAKKQGPVHSLDAVPSCHHPHRRTPPCKEHVQGATVSELWPFSQRVAHIACSHRNFLWPKCPYWLDIVYLQSKLLKPKLHAFAIFSARHCPHLISQVRGRVNALLIWKAFRFGGWEAPALMIHPMNTV